MTVYFYSKTESILNFHCLCLPVLCSVPQSPVNGSVDGWSSLHVGTEVTYRCNDGLFPTGVITSTCTNVGGRGEWVPDPAHLMCSAPGMPHKSLCI